MRTVYWMNIRLLASFAALAALSGVLSAQSTGMSNIGLAINDVCGMFLAFLPPLAILLVVVGAVFFGAGKLVPNAEFTNRSTNMAAGAIVGAVLCLVIVLLVPTILQTLYGGTFSCGTQTWG